MFFFSKVIYKKLLLLGLIIVMPSAGAKSTRHELHHCDFGSDVHGRSYEQTEAIHAALNTYGLKPASKADFAYHVLPNGSIDLVVSQFSDASKQENYYYEQSIWEAAPFKVYGENFAPTQFYSVSFAEATPYETPKKLDSKYVKIHVIPASVLRLYPGSFSLSEITSAENTKEFEAKYADSPLLTMYRTQWNYYLMTNPAASKDAIIKKSIEMMSLLTKLREGGRFAKTLSLSQREAQRKFYST